MLITRIGEDHVRAIADLHSASLKGLLTDLGPGAVRAYYTGVARARAAVGFVSLDGGRLRGFVLGAVRPADLKNEVLRRNPLGTLAGIASGILSRPSVLRSLLHSFHGPDEGSYDASCAELTYLAVAAEGRGSGAGRQLVEAFNGGMREAGVPFYELSVDDDNLGAIRFYEREGFAHVGSYREFGIVHRRYRLDLSAAAAPTFAR